MVSSPANMNSCVTGNSNIPSSDGSKVKVAIRVRPFNRREIELGTQCVVDVNGQQICLNNPSSIPHPSSQSKVETSGRNVKQFAFDNCFWSFNENDTHFASQELVYKELGLPVLESSFQGYNACIFAYGQTGSGKSYTMMGSPSNKGLIPRLCDGIFDRIASNKDSDVNFKVEVSYMEIYNEKVHDLLDPRGVKTNLKVREHNILGPYVDGLSKLAVSSFEEIDNLMTEGNKSRTVAATNMNSESSRSHAVFTITLTCSVFDADAGVTGEKVSKMSLVDLAGSERAVKTGAVGERLKEGSNINKSLTTLGLVISKLADSAAGKSKSDQFVPYRDSVLTWLLKDNLGGNSKTVMVATISPAADNYDESLSTLRYADRAKRIVNHAVINEDPNARMIRELKEEVEMLREQLKSATLLQQQHPDDLKERLIESEKLIKEMTQTWEEKLRKTETIHHERQLALEKMGISVQSSGIKVQNDKFYLVNLNADPSMNELLVYYLKERTLVGRSDAPVEQDIQLSGIGIQPEHCILEIDREAEELYMVPLEGARNCVNGSVIQSRTKLKQGDRILWGNNHFFKVSCPRKTNISKDSERKNLSGSTLGDLSQRNQLCPSPRGNSPDSSSTTDDERLIDFEFAREELMMKELSNDPIQCAWKSLEKQHEEDKLRALEKQKEMYEKQLQMLRNQMSPSTPYAPYNMANVFDPFGSRGCGLNVLGLNSPSVQSKMDKWAKERDELFKKSLAKLKEDIVKANSLVLEANAFSQEMSKQTEFKVTLQIPAANLSPNRRKGAFVSEPAILVRRKNKIPQVWSMEKLENKLIDMRELYAEWKSFPSQSMDISSRHDPFYETQETHHLIGVASIFLEVLFHDVTLDYHVPVINQQGEVAGRLHVEISRVGGQMGERMADAGDEEMNGNNEEVVNSPSPDYYTTRGQVAVRIVIKSARGLPISLSNYVFCQYTFWGSPDAIVVPVSSSERTNSDKKPITTCSFNHSKEFIVNLSEEFLEHCAEGALSIEVWGHRSAGFSTTRPGWEVTEAVQVQMNKSLSDRWSELKRKIELWVEIQELNDNGEYIPVEVSPRESNITGGVYQLRQGQQRRLFVRVNPVADSGTLPIICEAITSVSVGGVQVRSRALSELDSYQEDDLKVLKDKWKDVLDLRRSYLRDQMIKLENKKDKSDDDEERQKKLLDQWVALLEEEKALDDPHSEIPGADPPEPSYKGMEQHVPVIFLDLSSECPVYHFSKHLTFLLLADDMRPKSEVTVAGLNLILPKELGSQFFNLPIVRYNDDVSVIVVWDSSIHDSPALNRASSPEERISLIVRVSVRLSHPFVMELVLRKRISVNVYKKQSLTDRLKKKISRVDQIVATGVTYEVVSSIPKESEDIEDRESLAALAVSGIDNTSFDGESYIEKYTKGVSAVESILALDKLRQEVAVKELLTAKNGPSNAVNDAIRKTLSVPNFGLLATSNSSMSRLDGRADFGSGFDISSLISRASNLLLNSGSGASPQNVSFNSATEKLSGGSLSVPVTPSESSKNIIPPGE